MGEPTAMNFLSTVPIRFSVRPTLMNFPLIDSHAHLDFDVFDDDRTAVFERARAVGVQQIVSIGTTVTSSKAAAALASSHDMVFSTAGIHPHRADDFDDADWPVLEALWQEDKVVGVGETGLDYFYDHGTPERQKELFARHLRVAQALDYPVVIHIRDAFDDAFDIIEREGCGDRGIVHCFTGGVEACRRALDLGLYISLSGIVTFKNAKALREAVELIPLERVLVETDSPFLAPVPHRGKRNEPSFVVETAKTVATLMGVPLEELSRHTIQNTRHVFRLPTTL